jgi:hypothetical protein
VEGFAAGEVFFLQTSFESYFCWFPFLLFVICYGLNWDGVYRNGRCRGGYIDMEIWNSMYFERDIAHHARQ